MQLPELRQEQGKRNLLSETNVKLAAAIIALAAAVLNFFGRSPNAAWAIGLVSAALLVWFGVPLVIGMCRKMALSYRNCRYVAKEHAELERKFERLKKLTSRNDTRAFRYMMYQASSYRSGVIDEILASDYIEDWMNCFSFQLTNPCRFLPEFMHRCSEFTTILTLYNGSYVIRTQKALEKSSILPEHCIEQFEEFRERFNVYLHEVEQWTESLATEAQKQLTYQEFIKSVPHRSFERAKSFRQKVTVAAGAQASLAG